MTSSPPTRFHRRTPSKLLLAILKVLMTGVAAPIKRAADKKGSTIQKMKWLGKIGQRQRTIEKTFGDYTPTTADILVCTYLKSGTNWMMQITHQIAHRGKGEYDHIHDLIPWPEMKLPHFAIGLEHPAPRTLAPTGLRIIKTHLQAAHVPINKDAKYITVIRDPKDVFVSSYHFIQSVGVGPLLPTIEDWLDHFLDKNFLMGGSWAVHTSSYWKLRHQQNHMVLSFKELKTNAASVIAQLTDWMGVTLNDEEFNEVIKRSSFSFMKNIDHKFHPGKITPYSENGGLIRQGKHGASSEMLSIDQQKRIDSYFQQELEDLGTDFPYAKFCSIT